MKKFCISTLALGALSASSIAQQNYSAFVREITIESINNAPNNPDQWIQKQHDPIIISEDDVEPALGELVSTYPIGKGLWFGLYAETAGGSFELIASRIVGAQPTSTISVVSLDTDTNDDSVYIEPITRADVPFTVSINVDNISDDSLLQQSVNGQDVVDDLVTFNEYPPATKYMKLTRHTSELDENGVEVETLVDSAYTHGAGQVFLTRIDDISDLTSQSYEANQVLSLLASDSTDLTAVNGREIYKTYVVPDYSWDGSDPDNTIFIETEEAKIRVLPTAYADTPVDANDRPVQGELYYALPILEWPAKQLYPRSVTRIALYVGDPNTSSPVAMSDLFENDNDTDVKPLSILWNLADEGAVVNVDGVTYTAVLETKTPIDFNGDGISDELWEEIDRVSFSYNREINVNGVVVTSE